MSCMADATSRLLGSRARAMVRGLPGGPSLSYCLIYIDSCGLWSSYRGWHLGLFAPETLSGKAEGCLGSLSHTGRGWCGEWDLPGQGGEVSQSSLEYEPIHSQRFLGAGSGPQELPFTEHLLCARSSISIFAHPLMAPLGSSSFTSIGP